MRGDADQVDIVVPSWNRRDDLVRLLVDLRGQTLVPHEVIVVDNGSDDGSAEAAEEQGARVVRLPKNRGFAAAVNAGLRLIQTPWVGILNNDVTLAHDYLERLTESASPSSAAFAVGRIMRADNADEIDATYDLLTRSGCAWRAGHRRPDSPAWRSPGVVHFAPMTAALFRTSVFEEFGPLDEEFESYLEDLEFSARLARAGRLGVYVPEAVAWHRGSSTLGAGSPAMMRLVSRNQVLLAARHFPSRCLCRIVAGQMLWGLLAFRRGAGAAWLAGKVTGLGHWRRWRRSPPNADRFMKVLRSCEAELRRLQNESGWDSFWNWYFRLLP